MVNYSPIEVCVVKPGQPETKIEMSTNCTIRELRRIIKKRMDVEPERQLLLHNGQVLVDEHPETKREMIVTDTVDFKGNVTDPNSTNGHFAPYVLRCNNYFCKRNVRLTLVTITGKKCG